MTLLQVCDQKGADFRDEKSGAILLLVTEGTDNLSFSLSLTLKGGGGGTHSLIPCAWMTPTLFLFPLIFFFSFSGLVQPPLPPPAQLGSRAGQQPEGRDDEFRNTGSAERLGCQPPKHFPA